MNENMSMIKVTCGDNDTPTVSGRELHKALGVKTAYKDWFPRMCEYGFSEGVDFNPLIFEQVRTEGERQVAREITDHQLTIPMAWQRNSACSSGQTRASRCGSTSLPWKNSGIRQRL